MNSKSKQHSFFSLRVRAQDTTILKYKNYHIFVAKYQDYYCAHKSTRHILMQPTWYIVNRYKYRWKESE